MTSPNYTSYSSMVALPAQGGDPDDDDVILHGFADDLEVVIHPIPAANGAPAAAAPAFKFPSASPPTPPASGAPDPNVDYNRVLLPMKPGHEAEQGQRPHILAKKDGVEYLQGSKRERFRVETGYSMRRDGVEFDTKLIKAPYLAGGIGFQALPSATQDQIEAWAETSLIWVCAVPKGKQSVQFYSHVCRPGKIHHSSLSAGGTVVGAGEWIVRGGKLARISANSGHYQPTIDFLYRSVLHLADTRQPDTTIFLYDSKTQTWVDRSWSDFISSPTDNGRYWTHPNAELK